MKLVIASLLVMSLLLFGCTQGPPASALTEPPATTVQPAPTPSPSPVPEPTAAPSPEPSTAPAESGATQSAVKEFSLTAKQWEFQPSTITVKRGNRVKLTIHSIDVTHGFGLPDFGVSSRLEPGQDTLVEFTADKTGSFRFFCDVFCGSGHGGMTGTLLVEEN